MGAFSGRDIHVALDQCGFGGMQDSFSLQCLAGLPALLVLAKNVPSHALIHCFEEAPLLPVRRFPLTPLIGTLRGLQMSQRDVETVSAEALPNPLDSVRC